MKGILLAWGFGSRLHPITKSINKHLLLIYDKPMIYYPLETMIESGVDKIMIITTPDSISSFVNLLQSWEEFRDKYKRPIQIVYAIQTKPTWIADGLWIARDYVGKENCILMLGDNIFTSYKEIGQELSSFVWWATVFYKKVSDPERFWVAEITETGKVISLEEKPKEPKSNCAVVGVYIYDNTCFEKCIGQPTSARWEYEITYINQMFMKEEKLKAVELSGDWLDAGTFDSLLDSGNLIRENRNNPTS